MIAWGDALRLAVPRGLRQAFGIDEKRALEVARLLSASRREVLEREVRA